jgi:hypothetical protein
MATDKVPMITDLSEEDRKLAQKYTDMLLLILKQCEAYCHDYAAGFLKFLGMMTQTGQALDEVVDELSKINGLRTRIVPPEVHSVKTSFIVQIVPVNRSSSRQSIAAN